jgi:hypothetical protein
VGDDSALDLADFDRYVEEHGIPEEDYPAALASAVRREPGRRVSAVGEGELRDWPVHGLSQRTPVRTPRVRATPGGEDAAPR